MTNFLKIEQSLRIKGQPTIQNTESTTKPAKSLSSWFFKTEEAVALTIAKNFLYFSIVFTSTLSCKAFEVDWRLYEKKPEVKQIIDKSLDYIISKEGFSQKVFMDGKVKAMGFGDNYLKKEYPNLKEISYETAFFRAKKHIMRDFLVLHKSKESGHDRSYFYALTINQQISVLDLIYNAGINAYETNQIKHLLKRLTRGKRTYCGQIESAFLQPNYTHQKGVLLKGLVKRRVENLNLFFEDTNCNKVKYESVLKRLTNRSMKKNKIFNK